MRLTTFHRAALLIIAAALTIAALWWKCRFDPTINFLPSDHRAEWIVFPTPLDAGAHTITTLDTVFRKEVELPERAKSAQLQLRAARRVELKINGKIVEIGTPKNWKDFVTADVTSFLQIGVNTIEARVFNDDAPPALWLRLSIDASQVPTDESWQASIAGSAWRSAVVASASRHPGPGNLLAGGERTSTAVAAVWPIWIGFATIAVLLLLVASRLTRVPKFSRWQTVIVVCVAAAGWLALLWHNASMLPFVTGFDATYHAQYIKYIQEHRSLPLPNEGYEMFQPPFYYALSAGVLSIFRLSTDAVSVLRALTICFGVIHFVIALLCLRLLFPGETRAQLVGFALAAFLPMHLYLSHYVTNETLAALLVSISIYLALRILKMPAVSIWQYCALGLCIGAAMLTKATSILLVPAVFGALIAKMVGEPPLLKPALKNIGATLTAVLITCGWYYAWIWRNFGKPIVGNWERALGFNWWQDPGFHTARQYLRFGSALIDPLFSGYNSFGDGVYSTLWGDGLGGGLSDMLSRTPWDYGLMIAGYWLAIVPSLLIAVGVVVALMRLIRKPSPEWFLLLGFAATVAVALVFMTLRVASYAQVKAFYGLSAIVPICAFAAIGWQKLGRPSPILRFAVTTFLLIWVLNSFCAVWIGHSVNQRIYAARQFIREHRQEAAIDEATRGAQENPSNSTAQCFLGAILTDAGRTNDATAPTQRGLELDSADGHCQIELAIDLAKHGDFERAMGAAHRLVQSQPENMRAWDILFGCARRLQQTSESIAIGKDALAVSPFDPNLHYRVGLAAGEIGDFATAVPQFAYALLLEPKQSDPEEKLRLALSFLQQTPDAANVIRDLQPLAESSPKLLEILSTYQQNPSSSP